MRTISHSTITALFLAALIVVIVALNVLLPYPDSNDYQGLARICLLMDENVKYSVNNNWGFAHPLSCWLLTKITDDVLLSQRLLNALFMLLYGVLLLRMVRRFTGAAMTQAAASALFLFAFSPWMLDGALSVHMDIIPVTLLFAAVSVVAERKSAGAFIAAGVVAGAAYWFRFHFLTMALLFPVLAGAIAGSRGDARRGILLSAAGVAAAVAVPHFLCLLAYGVFGISNERFVLAYALGAVDWTYESAEKLTHMTVADMFRNFDVKRFVLAYGYHFATSVCFPLLLIVAAALRRFLRERRDATAGAPADGVWVRTALFAALLAAISVIPFTVVRGFTFRLEAAFALFAFVLVVAVISGGSRKTAWMMLILLLPWLTLGQVRYWRGFCAERAALVSTDRIVARTIPPEVLKKSPERIINCAGYYNPHNRYRLCNPLVFAGWGVRFKPFIEKFGLLDLGDPYGSDLYRKAEYLILPTRPEPDVFSYPGELITRNLSLYGDAHITILRRATEE